MVKKKIESHYLLKFYKTGIIKHSKLVTRLWGLANSYCIFNEPSENNKKGHLIYKAKE